MRFGGVGVCLLLVAIACGKAKDGPLFPTGSTSGEISDASMVEADAAIGNPNSNPSPDDPITDPSVDNPISDPPFATPGTGVSPAEMSNDYRGPAIFAADAGVSLAIPCPVMEEEVLATLDGDQYVLGAGPRPYEESRITKSCDGFAWWEFESCDEAREVCLQLLHILTPDDVMPAAYFGVGDEDNWATELDQGELGESFWCEKDGRWQVWIDTAFTKDAFQTLDGPTLHLQVSVKTYVPGEVCQRVE
jgi:hypothetical protein